MDLLLDFGNSRLKWALADTGHLVERGAVADADELMPAICEWRSVCQRVMLASVRDGALVTDLTRKLRGEGFPGPRIARTEKQRAGLRNAYPEPERMGVDRWLAMLGARRHSPGALVVVDCGTALTMDFVAGDGRHQGGLILPGIDMMVASLVERAPGIRIRPDDPEYAFPAVDTGAAVNTAARMAGPALVERAWREFSRQTEVSPELMLTGGDADRIAAQLEFPASRCPDLVFAGMLAILESEE